LLLDIHHEDLIGDSMPFCAKCGAKLTETARFCSSCGKATYSGAADLGGIITDALRTAGKEMEDAFKTAGQEIERAFRDVRSDLYDRAGPFCPKCGKRNPLGASFCFSCGGSIPSAA
jgi:predicted amidophosphoribosyltransferase